MFLFIHFTSTLCKSLILRSLSNYFALFAAYVVALTLRLLGGEPILSLPAAIQYPWYDAEKNVQHFPYKTLSMLIGFIVLVSVSAVTNPYVKKGKLRTPASKTYELEQPESEDNSSDVRVAEKSL